MCSMLNPVRQLQHVCRVDAEEDVQAFRQLHPGLDPPQVVLLFLCAERALHRSRPHPGKFLSDKVFPLLLLAERPSSWLSLPTCQASVHGVLLCCSRLQVSGAGHNWVMRHLKSSERLRKPNPHPDLHRNYRIPPGCNCSPQTETSDVALQHAPGTGTLAH